MAKQGNGEAPQGEQQKSEAHRSFAAMVASYGLGTFNENFFKEAAMLLAVSQGRTWLQGMATLIFASPYLLFAAHSGWLADRFSKRQVMVVVKLVEILFMTIGAFGLLIVNWWMIIAMAAFMALHSTIFSPALNGSLPEIYPKSYVTRANAIVKIVLMIGILAGVASAGMALAVKARGPWGVAWGLAIITGVCILMSIGGVIAALMMRGQKAASPKAPFPWLGPVQTVKDLRNIARDHLLAVVIAVDMFIWSLGSLQILVINPLGLKQFHYNEAVTGGMVFAELVGFGIGGLIVSGIAKGEKWRRVLAPGAVITAIFLALIALAPYLPGWSHIASLFSLLVLAGVGGGIVMVPCEAFIQTRAKPEEKGKVIAAANFAIFIGILLSGPLSNLLNAYLKPTWSFGVMGLGTLAAAAAIWLIFRKGNL